MTFAYNDIKYNGKLIPDTIIINFAVLLINLKNT